MIQNHLGLNRWVHWTVGWTDRQGDREMANGGDKLKPKPQLMSSSYLQIELIPYTHVPLQGGVNKLPTAHTRIPRSK